MKKHTETPICNLEMEKSVLASLINHYQTIVDTKDILTEECFFCEDHKEIFRAIMEVFGRGDTPDAFLVANEIGKTASGISQTEIFELCVNTQSSFGITTHAMLLRDFSFRRKMWEIGHNLMVNSGDIQYQTNSIQIEAKRRIDGLFEGVEPEINTLQTTYTSLQQHMLLNRGRQDGEIYGTPTGFPEIDNCGGLCGSDLIVIGAETSQGKTSFATSLAVSAIEHGDGVAFYSMEMTSLQLTARIASMKTGMPTGKILFNKLSIEDICLIDAAMERVDSSKMFFDEKSNSSLDSILMSIRSMKMKHDIKGAVVDYLQLVRIDDKQLNREQATARIARDLKNLAKELDIWIIAISQLNRNPQNPVPTMSRLRDSGQIAEAADIVALIYRPRDGQQRYPEPFESIPVDGTAMVTIGKGRNIGTSRFICGFKADNTLFYPITQYDLMQLDNRGSAPGIPSRPQRATIKRIPYS